MKNILILGLGNTLLSDEGFGVHAIDYLQTHYQWPENVQLVDGGTRGLLLMSELMECDIAIILDVTLGPNPPGSFYLLEDLTGDTCLSLKESMHQTSLSDILAACDLAGHKPDTLIFGFEPFDYQTMQATLTSQAQELLPQFCANVVEELEQRQIADAKEI